MPGTLYGIFFANNTISRIAAPKLKIDLFKAYLQERRTHYQLSAVRLFDEVQPLGYTGSLGTLRLYLQKLKTPRRQQQPLTVRYEIPSGKQGQVDWADCGRFPLASGEMLHLFVFVMALLILKHS